MSILDMVVALVRRRVFVGLSGLGLGVAAFLLGQLTPKTYTATTSLLPPQQSSSFSSSLLSQLGGLSSLAGGSALPGLKSPNDLYVGLLKSVTVEDGMIRRYDLQKDYKAERLSEARRSLEEHIVIDGSGKDGLIRISAVALSPARAAELANGYVDQYRQLSASLAIGEASQRRLFLEQQLQQTKNSLAKAEEDLKTTEQTTGVIQLDSQARALIESAGTLRGQIAEKEVQVQSMRTYAGSGNVELLQAEQELEGLKAQLAKLGGAGENGSDLMFSKGRIPQAGLDYVRKVREVKYNETIFDILARQYEAAKLDEAKEGALVQVVDVARPPDWKSGPSRLKMAVIGALIGWFLASVWVIFREALHAVQANPEYAVAIRRMGLGSKTRISAGA
jgi:tyrosine-protein kinase Etk/Wzc